MVLCWYVLRSKPNKEEFFWGQLIAHKIEVFYPCIRAKVANPRAHKDKPFFPGHLFIHVDLQDTLPSFLDGLPGSRGLVMGCAQPVEVSDALIAVICQRVNRINATDSERLPGLPSEDAFEIRDSPLTGYESMFDGCLDANERVHYLHHLLRGEQPPVELLDLERI